MVNAVEKTLLRKPRDLLKRIYQLEEEKDKLQSQLQKRPSLRNYQVATEYVVYLLKRLDPNKRKTTNLNQEFIKLYEFHFFGRTHEKAVERIKKDLKWKFLCKADPMLGRLKAADSFKKKYNKLIRKGGGKK